MKGASRENESRSIRGIEMVENHVKNEEGGRSYLWLGLSPLLTFTYPGFDCDSNGRPFFRAPVLELGGNQRER